MTAIIGRNKSGHDVRISRNVTNKHVFAMGKSGCGKTTALLSLITQMAEAGEVTVVINWKNSADHSLMQPAIRKEYEQYAKVLDVAHDGIALPLFTRLEKSPGEMENVSTLVQRVAGMLKVAGNLSPQQETTVQEGIKVLYDQGLYPVEGIAALDDYLLKQKKAASKNAASKLRSICRLNLFHDGNFWDDHSRIFEFDLNGLEYDDQLAVCRFLLDYFLRLATKKKFLETGLNLFVDEVQNLDFSQGSTIYTLFNESRRLNLRMLVATPNMVSGLKKDREILAQCGTCLYFQPADNEYRKVAEFIDPLASDKWLFILSRLKKGEYVAKGIFESNGKEIDQPVQLMTYVPAC